MFRERKPRPESEDEQASHHGEPERPPRLAVTLSASYYVVRCLTDPEAPRNAGAYRPVRVLAEEGSLVRARSPAAVAAGNVETSQRIVDVIFRALAEPLADRVPAQSQGTMNNLTIGASGRKPFSYYETIAGGEGALPFRDGMSGVHTHMTNTRNTPVEALELAYPLRVEEYRLIPSSGGGGLHPGGDGVRRSVRLLASRGTASILTERRVLPPSGLHGGVNLGEKCLPLLPLYALDEQSVVAQIETEQALPEGVARLSKTVRFRHQHLHAAVRNAAVTLAGEAVALRVGLAVGAEPDWIHDAPIQRRSLNTAFRRQDIDASDTRSGLGPLQLSQQLTHLAIDGGVLVMLALRAPSR